MQTPQLIGTFVTQMTTETERGPKRFHNDAQMQQDVIAYHRHHLFTHLISS